jgi:hypothetical protein
MGGVAAKLRYLATSHMPSYLSTGFLPFSSPRAAVTGCIFKDLATSKNLLELDRIYRIAKIFWPFSLPGRKGENSIRLNGLGDHPVKNKGGRPTLVNFHIWMLSEVYRQNMRKLWGRTTPDAELRLRLNELNQNPLKHVFLPGHLPV